jgi:Winged helix DNA-binding domain
VSRRLRVRTPRPNDEHSNKSHALASRYLAGHGPAGPPDLAKWAGITIRDASLGFDSIADELATVGDDLVVFAGRPEPMSSTPPRLLGAFDALLHGWASREPFVGQHIGVVTTNGIFRPVVLVDGRVVATWSLPDGVVSVRSLERIPAAALDALITDAADVLRFLGLPDKPVVVA